MTLLTPGQSYTIQQMYDILTGNNILSDVKAKTAKSRIRRCLESSAQTFMPMKSDGPTRYMCVASSPVTAS